jgi:hypothetical protein
MIMDFDDIHALVRKALDDTFGGEKPAGLTEELIRELVHITYAYVQEVFEPVTSPVFPRRHAIITKRIKELRAEMSCWRERLQQEAELDGWPHDDYQRTLAIRRHLGEIQKLLAVMKADHDAEVADAEMRAAQRDPESWPEITPKQKRTHSHRKPLTRWIRHMAHAWRTAKLPMSQKPDSPFCRFMEALHIGVRQRIPACPSLDRDGIRYAIRFG